jgi:hypothetical protein
MLITPPAEFNFATMLPAAAGSVGWMYPAKLSAALPKYRELLRTAHNSRSVESSTEESSR